MKLAAVAILGVLSAVPQEDPSRDLLRKIRTIRLDVDFRNSSLADVIDYVREFADINVVLDAGTVAPGPLTMKAKGVTIRSLLELLLKPHGIGYEVQEGVLRIRAGRDLEARVRLVILDVRDLLLPIRDFPGTEITLATDAAGVAFSSADERESAEIPIVELVKAHVGGKSWEDNPRASIQLVNGLLFVRQTDEVLGQVRKVVDGLRRFK